MFRYIITYDLRKVGQDYTGLYKALKSFTHIHPMQSVWFIKSPKSAQEIFNIIANHFDIDDSVFINEVSLNRSGWLLPSVWDFLK